jgi:uncharacterized protein YecE (DUF72 family)
VSPDFVFAVKASRIATHVDAMRATSRGRDAFAHDLRIARILHAPFVILETPPGLAFGPNELDGLSELAAIAPSEVRVGLEARAYRRGELPDGLRRTMGATRTIDVVDLSQTAPRVEDEVIYSRLFGPGPHNVYQFDDAELREIDRAGSDAIRTAFTFHGVRMYQDAARFLTFKRTGHFPPVTASHGLSSLEEVLRPDARFPASKQDLIKDQGWKVFDVDETTRAHAATFLDRLPDRVYRDLDDVVSELRTVSVGISP